MATFDRERSDSPSISTGIAMGRIRSITQLEKQKQHKSKDENRSLPSRAVEGGCCNLDCQSQRTNIYSHPFVLKRRRDSKEKSLLERERTPE